MVIPILAMIVFGMAVVVFVGANGGNTALTPPAGALGFPPATLAGAQFTAAASDRGISQTLGQVASDGAEVVAVGSQSGAPHPTRSVLYFPERRAFMVHGNGADPGRGRAATGARGAFRRRRRRPVGGGGARLDLDEHRRPDLDADAVGRDAAAHRRSDRRAAPDLVRLPRGRGEALPRRRPGQGQPGALCLPHNGISWQRLDAQRLALPAGTGHVLDIKYAAVAGSLTLIAGDVTTTTTKVTGSAKHKTTATVTAVTSGTWLSRDGGSTWVTAVSPAAAPAGQPQITGVAAVNGGFVLVRPATVARAPALAVYRSADGAGWKLAGALTAPGGLSAGLVDGGPAGAVITGRAGQDLVAFVSATGASWPRTPAFGQSSAESVSAVADADGHAVVTATVTGSHPRLPAISVVTPGAPVIQVNVAQIPGAFDPQLAVNDIAADGGTQVAVGGANGYPAAWTSANGGSSWVRAVGATPATFDRPGTEQLTSVTHGAAGWLAVGDVTAGAPQHPVVLASADGQRWQAADGAAYFGERGLVTKQAAAGRGGYVIVGEQVTATGTLAAAWRSTTLAGATAWQRAAVGESAGDTQLQAVTASSTGFVAVGSSASQAAAWTSANGQAWHQVSLPMPIGAPRAVLQHVASSGRTVVAVGTAVITTGQRLPFAASSSNGGLTWTESVLPMPGRAGLGRGADRGRRHVHRDWDVRRYTRSPGCGRVDLGERVGLDGGHAHRAGPERSRHPGDHGPVRLGQRDDRRRLHGVTGQRRARLLAVPAPLNRSPRRVAVGPLRGRRAHA